MGFPFQQQTAVTPDAIRSLGTHSASLQPIALPLKAVTGFKYSQ